MGTSALAGEEIGEPECGGGGGCGESTARNLMLVGEVFRRRLADAGCRERMIDVAKRPWGDDRAGAVGSGGAGCGVVLANALAGAGIEKVRFGIREAKIPTPAKPVPADQDALAAWADEIHVQSVRADRGPGERRADENTSDRVDRVLLHPVGDRCGLRGGDGWVVLVDLLGGRSFRWSGWAGCLIGGRTNPRVDGGWGDRESAGGWDRGWRGERADIPAADFINLFFIISLLEDTGYLARGAFADGPACVVRAAGALVCAAAEFARVRAAEDHGDAGDT